MKMKKIILWLWILAILSLSRPVFAEHMVPTGKRTALLIGNQNYRHPKVKDLSGPINDIYKMELMLLAQKEDYEIQLRKDLTKEDMIRAIRETFAQAKEEDFHILFYAGHGGLDGSKNSSFLAGTDCAELTDPSEEGRLYAEELEQILKEIPGTFWVILDCCNSGGFIDDKASEVPFENPSKPNLWTPVGVEDSNMELSPSEEEWSEGFADFGEEDGDAPFLQGLITPFSYRERGLYGDKYFVFAAAEKTHPSAEVLYGSGWGWGGELTRAVARGNGYRNIFLADQDKDGRVSFNELTPFAKRQVRRSRMMTYPSVSDAVLGTSKTEIDPQAPVRYHVPVHKVWNIRFNKPMTDSSASRHILVSDWTGKPVPVELKSGTDKTVIEVKPQTYYEDNSYYQLKILSGLQDEAKTATLNRDKILHFFTQKYEHREEALQLVQNGYLEGYPSKTVKQAFEVKVMYEGRLQPLFSNPSWNYVYDPATDEHQVIFLGTLKKNEETVELKAVFTVDLKEKSFAMTFIGIGNQPLTEEERRELFELLYS